MLTINLLYSALIASVLVCVDILSIQIRVQVLRAIHIHALYAGVTSRYLSVMFVAAKDIQVQINTPLRGLSPFKVENLKMRFPTIPLDADRAIRLPGRVNGWPVICNKGDVNCHTRLTKD